MSAGALDRQILLEFKTAGQSGSGEPTEAWGGAATVWAFVEPLSGREFYSLLAVQMVASEMLRFRIRFRADVRPNTARVTYPATGGRLYNIRRVAEVGRRAYLDIDADTVTA